MSNINQEGSSYTVHYTEYLVVGILKYCYLNLITMVFEVYQITGLNTTFLITSNLKWL